MTCLGLAVISQLPMLPHRVPSTEKWTFVGSWIAIVPLAVTTSLTVFPEHIFNPAILRGLFERLITRDGGGHAPFATAIASGKLYLGILLFKLGLPFGIATTVALGWGA